MEYLPSTQTQSRVRVRRASISEPSDTDPEPRTQDPSPAGKSALPPALPCPSPALPSPPIRRDVSLGGVERCRGPPCLSSFLSVWREEERLLLGSSSPSVLQGMLVLWGVRGIPWPDRFGRCCLPRLNK